MVKEIKPLADARPCFSFVGVGFEMDLLEFDRAPQPLDNVAARIAYEPTHPLEFARLSPVIPARSSTWPLGQEIIVNRQLSNLIIELARLPLALLLAIATPAAPPSA